MLLSALACTETRQAIPTAGPASVTGPAAAVVEQFSRLSAEVSISTVVQSASGVALTPHRTVRYLIVETRQAAGWSAVISLFPFDTVGLPQALRTSPTAGDLHRVEFDAAGATPKLFARDGRSVQLGNIARRNPEIVPGIQPSWPSSFPGLEISPRSGAAPSLRPRASSLLGLVVDRAKSKSLREGLEKRYGPSTDDGRGGDVFTSQRGDTRLAITYDRGLGAVSMVRSSIAGVERNATQYRFGPTSEGTLVRTGLTSVHSSGQGAGERRTITTVDWTNTQFMR